ncbi:helix-turn-helix domain-containing protein [Actinoplanes sp. NPDC051633]|uniref:helix-turn-helix domain-containing protein n=1 Tax=Actinoplanes sp. NPDC051633 TaxID=3155670 RepID=UPI00342187F7
MDSEWLSPEQVAERLGLHVRTVRGYIRDQRLHAVRIGKQYRIARADLDAFIGRPAPARPRAEVSAVIEIADVDRVLADRLSTLVVAGAQQRLARAQVIYDGERSRLKVIVIGDVPAATDVLHALEGLLGDEGSGDD